ncbi:MAG: carboxypeptidase-like regulatory domain-containing protein [Saprospiraceae bacterium]
MIFPLFLILLSVNLQAQSPLTKIINFDIENTPIADALIELSEVADINIAFHPRLFNKAQKISGVFEQKSVDYILKKCLAQTRITYKLESGNLILYEKPLEQYTISGYIQDAKTGERLVAATIWEAKSGKGGTTNDYGFFSLKIPEGKAVLQVSYIGYQGLIKNITLHKSQKIQLNLIPSITLTEIIVTANNLTETEAHLNLGKGETVNLQNLATSIAIGGEPDILHAIRRKAGVQSGADGIGGMSVRGGNTDQNLILMDGVPIYNPSHTLGLFSVFNTHIVKSATMLTDGFSAKYGGRLSSVLDVRVKEGNTKEWSGIGEIGTLATKVTLEGPIQKDKSSLLLAMRRTHLDPFITNISQKRKEENFEEGKINYFFFDINAKFHHRFSNKDQLFFSFYKGKDDYSDNNIYEYDDFDLNGQYYFEERVQKIDWGNEIAALRWNHLFGAQLFSNTTFTLSRYKYSSLNIVDDIADDDEGFRALYDYVTFQSNIKDAGLKMDLEYYPAHNHQILFGGGVLFRTFESGLADLVVDDVDNLDDFLDAPLDIDESYAPPVFNTQEINFYIEDKISISDKFSLMGGLHIATFFTEGKKYIIPQPRLHLKWQFSPQINTAFSAGKMAQGLHILSETGGGLPNDLWVPSTRKVRPEIAWQAAWTANYVNKKGWSINLDVFYKKMNHLITFIDIPILPNLAEFDPIDWENEITNGQGKSYGISTSLSKKIGPTTGQINYAYTVSRRQFEDNNEGISYPFRYTHPHEIKMSVKHQITPKLAAFVGWQYGSGQPYSLVSTTSRYPPLSNTSDIANERIGPINGNRLPAYHRLDVGAYYEWGKRIKQTFNLGIYNIYNRKNPYFQYLQEDPDFPEENGLKQQHALPLLPSLAYRVVF